MGFKPFTDHLFKIQFQRYLASDVGIPVVMHFRPAEATYTDIGRNLLSASYEINNIGDKLSNLTFSYFNQYIDRNVSMLPNTVSQTTLPNGIYNGQP